MITKRASAIYGWAMNYGALYGAGGVEGVDDLRISLDEIARGRGHSEMAYADDWSVGFVIAVCDDADRMIDGNGGLFSEVSTLIIELKSAYWRFATPGDAWEVVDGTTADRVRGIGLGLQAFLKMVEPLASTAFLIPDNQIGLFIEEFIGTWDRVGRDLPLDEETRRIADAIIAMAAEVIKSEEPPAGLLKEAFTWLGGKLDLFADEAFKTAGKTAGVVVPGMTAAGISGSLPRLVQLAHMIVSAI